MKNVSVSGTFETVRNHCEVGFANYISMKLTETHRGAGGEFRDVTVGNDQQTKEPCASDPDVCIDFQTSLLLLLLILLLIWHYNTM
jgi:hypothetical protein